MKKNSITLVLIFTLIFLLCSGCVSSDKISSGGVSPENTSLKETDENIGESSRSVLNQGKREKSTPYIYWEYELGDITPENIS
ncbi:MAG: hypothetical protein QM426_05500 [Euryarchaeota archaeon]|nr:hypothetical protein [Euryarchaeota archaeon]